MKFNKIFKEIEFVGVILCAFLVPFSTITHKLLLMSLVILFIIIHQIRRGNYA